MEEKFTVKNAKNALYNEISSYYKKVEEIKEINSKINICNDIIRILNQNLKSVFQQTEAISFFLDMIYDELKSQNMYERIYLNVEKGAFTNDAIIRKEVDAALKIIIEQIEETKETLKLNYNKISYELSTEEEKNKKYKIILGNIKHDGYIGENYKELFVNLMHKYGASDVEIVEMFERIYIN